MCLGKLPCRALAPVVGDIGTLVGAHTPNLARRVPPVPGPAFLKAAAPASEVSTHAAPPRAAALAAALAFALAAALAASLAAVLAAALAPSPAAACATRAARAARRGPTGTCGAVPRRDRAAPHRAGVCARGRGARGSPREPGTAQGSGAPRQTRVHVRPWVWLLQCLLPARRRCGVSALSAYTLRWLLPPHGSVLESNVQSNILTADDSRPHKGAERGDTLRQGHGCARRRGGCGRGAPDCAVSQGGGGRRLRRGRRARVGAAARAAWQPPADCHPCPHRRRAAPTPRLPARAPRPRRPAQGPAPHPRAARLRVGRSVDRVRLAAARRAEAHERAAGAARHAARQPAHLRDQEGVLAQQLTPLAALLPCLVATPPAAAPPRAPAAARASRRTAAARRRAAPRTRRPARTARRAPRAPARRACAPRSRRVDAPAANGTGRCPRLCRGCAGPLLSRRGAAGEAAKEGRAPFWRQARAPLRGTSGTAHAEGCEQRAGLMSWQTALPARRGQRRRARRDRRTAVAEQRRSTIGKLGRGVA